MTSREDVARAMAFFEQTDDLTLLHQVVGDIAPRAKKMVGQFLSRGGEEAIPAPAELRPAKAAASRDEALKTVRGTTDFALLQVLARTVGRRIEAAEIAASAEFPEGARVTVPQRPTFPPSGTMLPGTVEETGTVLKVALDNGDTWSGPPSLARLERARRLD